MNAENDAFDFEGDGARWHRLVALLEGTTAGDDATSIDLDGAIAPVDRAGHDAGQSVPERRRDRLGRVCALSVSQVGVSGAGVTVMGSVEGGLAGHRDQLWATCPLARRLEDLQLTAGEGPCLDAYDAGAPVLVGDLDAEKTRWLGFGLEAIAAGVAAAFSLPLQVGAIRLGTLDLHRTTRGLLTRPQLADALVLATLAAEILLELLGDTDPGTDSRPNPGRGDIPGTMGHLPRSSGWLPDVHAEVHLASGMVAARDNVAIGEALLRLRGHAFAQSESISQVARQIIDRDLVLDHSRHEGPERP
jgi:hypothetical protein